MIHPLVTGGFQVVFGDGQKIRVPTLTDGELLVGARMDSRHGCWLAVLEEACGIIHRRDARKSKTPSKYRDIVPIESFRGGNPAETISLMTGRQTASLGLGKQSDREKLHNVLADTTKKRRLICLSENIDKPPPGIATGHCYAILGYDANRRVVTIFNPWGNAFKPKGAPGPANGYPTEHGQFVVPLDEFRQVFSSITYETDKPLAKLAKLAKSR